MILNNRIVSIHIFSYAQSRNKRTHGHRINTAQTVLDIMDFISKIIDMYIIREHRT